MSARCDVAIIGAGPYGLSLAAHLAASGIDFRIFGRRLATWAEHMPRDMQLKSDGFASNLSAPHEAASLKAWCTEHRVAYANQGQPIALDHFLAYGAAFQRRFVPQLEEIEVSAVEPSGDEFDLTRADGARVRAKHVVVAVGISHFAHIPLPLANLSRDVLSHSYEHRDGARFRGQRVVILGAGSSAIDLAAHLATSGAETRLVTRAESIAYNSVPDADAETLLYRIRKPASGIGRGWRSYFCANAPLLFYRLPQSLRRRAIESHMNPAAGWFMRDRIEGRVGTSFGRVVANARERDGGVVLTLFDRAGHHDTVECDHVIAATGYRVDTRRLRFLAPQLRSRMASMRHIPVVSDQFETPVPGLHVIGPAVIDSFGPLMRFMVGAEFAAPHLAARFARCLGVRTQSRAA
jgi:thioredoxin reductase